MRLKLQITLLSIVLMLLAASNCLAVSVTANILDSYIEVGETFDVQIWADSEMFSWELTGFGFDVDDTADSVLSYAGYSLDPFEFADSSDPFNPANVGGAALGFPVGNNLLSTLSFVANESGVGSFSLMGLYDGLFNGLFYFDAFADPFGSLEDSFPGADIFLTQEITVHQIENGSAPVPEPSTILLLGAGLGGLALYRRRSRQ